MAQPGGIEDISLGGVGIYRALSVVLVLITILYVNLTSTAIAVARFPLIGQSLGGYTKRRAFFATQALDLFREGHLKVPSNVQYRISHEVDDSQFKDSVWRFTSSDGREIEGLS